MAPPDRPKPGINGIRLKVRLLIAFALTVVLAGCQRHSGDAVQGYVEGEFVYVASPFAGALETLAVQRGSQVPADAPLFSLECAAETAARDQAVRRVEEANSQLADAKKGSRSTEIESLGAQLDQARAALALSDKEFVRKTTLREAKVVSAQEFDAALATRDQDHNRVLQLEADLKTAQLGSRSDQVAAAEANVKALQAVLAKATWDLDQKHQNAPSTALVFDTLYQEGEWVPASQPVISLLPPANIKVRAFVPEPRLAKIHLGQPAHVSIDGGVSFAGTVSFISPRAEFTPPVIYSQESRSKLVFMVEVAFAPEIAIKLHPGQPVDVHF
jgi:HlyD family secretion protein